MIEAIADERRQFRKLDASKRFGIYSIFSTHADYISGKQFITDDLVRGLAAVDHILNDASCHCPWSIHRDDLLPEVLKNYASLKIADAKNPGSKSFASGLRDYLKNLQDYEQTTLCLMNGMWGIPVSICLMYLTGQMGLDQIFLLMDSQNQIDDWDAHRDMQKVKEMLERIEWFLTVMREDCGGEAA